MKKYMLVIHYIFTDKIENNYFETKEQMKEYIKTLGSNKNWEILHEFEIKEI